MEPYRIAVWIDNYYIPEAGGGYSFLMQLAKKIDEMDFGPEIEIFFVGFDFKLNFKKKIVNLPFTESYFYRKKVNLYHKLFGGVLQRKDIERNFLNAQLILKNLKIDVIFYPTPGVALKNYPYILVNWDLGHRTTYPFPELSMDGIWERREADYAKDLGKAIIICAESEAGKNEIIRNYNILPDKISILPLFPGQIITPKIKEEKPQWFNQIKKFFLYPAQFWPHKNHYNLLLGFKTFLTTNQDYFLILPGSDKGNINYIKNVIDELQLQKRVILPGFISDENLKWLYKNSKGLIFPSLLGPTNMPLLEALALGCNVACSNLEGHKNMLGDSAIYFDPLLPTEISEAMEILDKKNVTMPLELALHSPLSVYNIENALASFRSVIEKSKKIRKTWGIQ
ncbi:glycosyltransferase family 4 protein [Pedobacter zeae]|uniref:Glycosyltransferase involved in cell wall biosynthesis n=1 Tax=Pedobacter zeae TaxID=1737356 RepID=A0A7W6K9P6_9SPHI|nr:glycosyltransferase family 1 protein [Pedobacter zeae]MBB4107801.1 glycosyltransferase involved in cell wall biosynthesis [Pedobacter zeae]GGG96968.1 hypothetical protein GCM10007422_08550 [Pedobacter zeae]